MMMGYWFGPWGWIGMVINAILSIALIGGLVWLGVWAFRRSGSGQYTSYPPAGQFQGTAQSAKEIAQMRYARGEITRDQYQELLEDLTR